VSEPLSFTGERFLPELKGEISYEHWHRYAFASQLSKGCQVLDVACGEGYGSAFIAETSRSVIGLDISPETIAHASNRYKKIKNLKFITGSCDHLPFPDDSFDRVVSFETIEHIEAQKQFLLEVRRVLTPEGLLIISSPNKQLYSDAHDHHNEFHVRELYRHELQELIGEHFPSSLWLGQRLLFQSAIWLQEQNVGSPELFVDTETGLAKEENLSIDPMYFLVVCSSSSQDLPVNISHLSLYSDSEQLVYQDYSAQIKRVMALDEALKDREELIAKRDETLQLRTQQMEESVDLINERDMLLEERNLQIEEYGRQISKRNLIIEERDQLLALRTEKLAELERVIIDRESLIAERDELLQETNEQVLKISEQLVMHEKLIAERDDLLQVRNDQLKERDGLIVERDNWLDELNLVVRDRESMIVERDELLEIRNDQLKERERLIAERDEWLVNRELQLSDLSALAQELKEDIAYKESWDWFVRSPWRLFLKLIGK
jgi:SAM-dependent methyltransferase